MALTKWETAKDESHFLLIAATVIFLISSLMYLLYFIPNVIAFLILIAAYYLCGEFWFTPTIAADAGGNMEQRERPQKIFIRALIDLVCLGNILAIAIFAGPIFAQQVTLYDAYQLRNRNMVSSDKAILVYMTYCFYSWVQALSIIAGIRMGHNIFTGTAFFAHNMMY